MEKENIDIALSNHLVDPPIHDAGPVQAGTTWSHRNGNVYRVVAVSNLHSDKDEYPPYVTYQGGNGRIWTRLLSDWHRSMTQVL